MDITYNEFEILTCVEKEKKKLIKKEFINLKLKLKQKEKYLQII